jgi:hypothetical protein
MDKQACTGDTELVKSREMTQTLPWWVGGEEVKTTETSNIGPFEHKPFTNIVAHLPATS